MKVLFLATSLIIISLQSFAEEKFYGEADHHSGAGSEYVNCINKLLVLKELSANPISQTDRLLGRITQESTFADRNKVLKAKEMIKTTNISEAILGKMENLGPIYKEKWPEITARATKRSDFIFTTDLPMLIQIKNEIPALANLDETLALHIMYETFINYFAKVNKQTSTVKNSPKALNNTKPRNQMASTAQVVDKKFLRDLKKIQRLQFKYEGIFHYTHEYFTEALEETMSKYEGEQLEQILMAFANSLIKNPNLDLLETVGIALRFGINTLNWVESGKVTNIDEAVRIVKRAVENSYTLEINIKKSMVKKVEAILSKNWPFPKTVESIEEVSQKQNNILKFFEEGDFGNMNVVKNFLKLILEVDEEKYNEYMTRAIVKALDKNRLTEEQEIQFFHQVGISINNDYNSDKIQSTTVSRLRETLRYYLSRRVADGYPIYERNREILKKFLNSDWPMKKINFGEIATKIDEKLSKPTYKSLDQELDNYLAGGSDYNLASLKIVEIAQIAPDKVHESLNKILYSLMSEKETIVGNEHHLILESLGQSYRKIKDIISDEDAKKVSEKLQNFVKDYEDWFEGAAFNHPKWPEEREVIEITFPELKDWKNTDVDIFLSEFESLKNKAPNNYKQYFISLTTLSNRLQYFEGVDYVTLMKTLINEISRSVSSDSDLRAKFIISITAQLKSKYLSNDINAIEYNELKTMIKSTANYFDSQYSISSSLQEKMFTLIDDLPLAIVRENNSLFDIANKELMSIANSDDAAKKSKLIQFIDVAYQELDAYETTKLYNTVLDLLALDLEFDTKFDVKIISHMITNLRSLINDNSLDQSVLDDFTYAINKYDYPFSEKYYLKVVAKGENELFVESAEQILNFDTKVEAAKSLYHRYVYYALEDSSYEDLEELPDQINRLFYEQKITEKDYVQIRDFINQESKKLQAIAGEPKVKQTLNLIRLRFLPLNSEDFSSTISTIKENDMPSEFIRYINSAIEYASNSESVETADFIARSSLSNILSWKSVPNDDDYEMAIKVRELLKSKAKMLSRENNEIGIGNEVREFYKIKIYNFFDGIVPNDIQNKWQTLIDSLEE